MTFVEAKRLKETFKCDHCKEKFQAHEVILSNPVDNVQILTPMMPFVYVDKDGVIMGGREQPTNEKGDRLLTCPRCNAPHLFGFDVVKD